MTKAKKTILKWLDGSLRAVLQYLPKNGAIPAHVNRVLVIKLSAMGDAFCLMPSIRALKHSSPSVMIDWLTTNRTNPSIFKDLSFISNVVLVPTSPLALLIFVIIYFSRWGRYDLIIDFDQYYFISELFAYAGKSSTGFSTELKGSTFSRCLSYAPTENEKRQFFSLVSRSMPSSTIHSYILSPKIFELTDNLAQPASLSYLIDRLELTEDPVVVVYPGSSGNAVIRRWPLNRYHDTISILSRKCIVIIAGGPDETEIAHQFKSDDYRIYNLIGELSIKDWLWFFRHRADLFIGNDAGMLHLAESQDLPLIGLFGPNLGSKWGSLNINSQIIDVNLECRPCIKTHLGIVPQNCARQDIACMSNITVDMVIAAVSTYLKVEFIR